MEVEPQGTSPVDVTKSAPNLRKFTRQEVAKHSQASSLWIVIHDHVYDVTEFMNKHPGGMEVLLEYAGMDATSAFEGKGHSSEAKELLSKYFIGITEDEKLQHHPHSPYNMTSCLVGNIAWGGDYRC